MKLIIGFMFEFLILIFVLWIINIFSIFVHEIGHASGYMIATKDSNWNVKIGKGRMVYKTRRFNIYLIPISGYFSPINMEKSISKTKIIAILIGGPLASLLLLILLLLVRKNINSLVPVIVSLKTLVFLTNYSMIFNLNMFIASALPYKPRPNGYVSDGWKILRLFKK